MRAYATDVKKSFLTSVAPQGFFLPGHHRVGTHSLDMQVTTARARAATTGSILAVDAFLGPNQVGTPHHA